MKIIEVKITIEEKVWEKWDDFYNGGENKVVSSLHNDIKYNIDKLGIENYQIITKILENN